MTLPSEVRREFYTLRALAIALGTFALATYFLWPNSLIIRSLGSLCIFAGLWLIQRSNACVRRARGQGGGEQASFEVASRVSPLAWFLTAASFIACIVFYFVMTDGGSSLWPVAAFAGASIAFAVTSGYIAMKFFR